MIVPVLLAALLGQHAFPDDVDAAFARAKRTHKPVLMAFAVAKAGGGGAG